MGAGTDDTQPATTERKASRASARDHGSLLAVDPSHFELGQELARGGMGRIVIARDRRLGRDVAIKQLLAHDADSRARFEREARITARLQHPGIVQIIEAGVWPDGEPFYVMKLVRGKSLDRAIAACKTLDDRLRLLANATAVVDALAYAHAESVIHRDLKPANVLVGDFGETVVIDWGLAKAAGEPDDTGATLPSSITSADATEVGTVLGTPSYMPPEQARGEVVDERADVYALGAMLYHILAGAPPYGGATADTVIARVLAGPPKALRERVEGLPRDLRTIVAKAMAREKSARYASARELADDLARFQAGQLVGAHDYTAWQLLRRWLRRYRTPVAVAAIAVAALAVMAVIGVRRIVREQRAADRNRASVQDAMEFMLGEMHDKLRPLGRLDLLEPIARKAVAYYGSRDDLTLPEVASQARAEASLATALLDEGDLNQALPLQERALARYQVLALAEPGNLERTRDLHRARASLGTMRVSAGDHALALALFQLDLDLETRVRAAHPGDLEWEWFAEGTQQQIGALYMETEDFAAAERAFRAELAIAEDLAKHVPDASLVLHDVEGTSPEPAAIEWRRALAWANMSIADALDGRGEGTEALPYAQRAQQIFEALVREDPTKPRRRHELVGALRTYGQVLATQGHEGDAEKIYRDAIATAETDIRRDPTDEAGRVDLLHVREDLARLLTTQRKLDEALAELQGVETSAGALAARAPKSTNRQLDLAVAHERVGDVLSKLGQIDAALAQFQNQLAVCTALATAEPTPAYRRGAELAHMRVARVLASKGDLHAALPHARAGTAVARELLALDPTSEARDEDVASAAGVLGELLVNLGDTAAGIAAYREQVAALERALATQPANLKYQRWLAAADRGLGTAFLDRDPASAMTAFRAGMAIAESLAAREPDDRGFQFDLAWAHQRYGIAALVTGAPATTIAETGAALALAGKLGANESRQFADRQLLWQLHYDRGRAELLAKDRAAATVDLSAALALAEAGIHDEPARALWHAYAGAASMSRGDAAADGTSDFRRALELLGKDADPADVALARAGLARALLATGHGADALREAAAAVALLPDADRPDGDTDARATLAAARAALAQAQLAAGQRDAAATTARAATSWIDAVVTAVPARKDYAERAAEIHQAVAKALAP